MDNPNSAHHYQDQHESYEGASFIQDYQEEDEIPEDFIDHISSIEEAQNRSQLANKAPRVGTAGARPYDDQVADYTDDIETQIDVVQVDSVPRSYHMGSGPANSENKYHDKFE